MGPAVVNSVSWSRRRPLVGVKPYRGRCWCFAGAGRRVWTCYRTCSSEPLSALHTSERVTDGRADGRVEAGRTESTL